MLTGKIDLSEVFIFKWLGALEKKTRAICSCNPRDSTHPLVDALLTNDPNIMIAVNLTLEVSFLVIYSRWSALATRNLNWSSLTKKNDCCQESKFSSKMECEGTVKGYLFIFSQFKKEHN